MTPDAGIVAGPVGPEARSRPDERAHGRPPWPAPRVRRQSGVDQDPGPTCRSAVALTENFLGGAGRMRSTVWWWIPALSVGLLGAAPPEKDAWTLTKVQGGGCRLDADKGSLSDGYQTTSVQVRVSASEVRVVSESTFDDSKGGLQIQIDKNE